MGSSSAKRFSLRSIGSAAALIFLVLLLVVAGGVATLHHRDNTPERGVVVRVNDRLLPRKILRLEVIEEASSSIDFANQQHRPPPLLPRGLVRETSNLEMEPSLAGDPERMHAAAPTKPKSLLAVPVGIKNKAVVDKLVSKFLAADFTVMLFHYDGEVEQWGDLEWSDRAVHVAARGQTKWWFAKRFLHPDVVAEYDYVFVWDEDIEVDAFDPVRYLDVVRREGLEVSQPALDRRSEIHHAITARPLLPTADGVHRRVRGNARCDGDSTGPPCVGWVEVMVPVFSRAAWRCAWGMVQNDLIHGWGLDYRLGYCAQGDRAINVGVVDSEYVLHRGVPMLSDGGTATPSAGRAAVRLRSFKEMQVFNRRWGVAAAEDDSWTDPYTAAEPRTAK
ncbi:unnamed protein product [Miscanthus lutarioriparius]|uniref:Uncharacterized protein n=1 Tax=Miscanthus lutarioriparius TaxID=422564 RepID=A0A811NJZ8_9POAL|nr:unnamed protein product [Miscanthus lutarioriparius]